MIAPIVTTPCPVCRTPHTADETTCSTCGLIFATRTAGSGIPIQPLVIAPALGLQPGLKLDDGRYTIQHSLARGGMGTIYLATDHAAFDRTVVIKVLQVEGDDEQTPEAEASRARFVQEARTLAALKHPLIPQIMTYFQDGPHSCIVMEYIEGCDLFQNLTHIDENTGQHMLGGAYSPEDVLRWGIDLCRILEYLVSRQPTVVHHDIKPANLVLDANSNELFLVDFGTARARLLDRGTLGTRQTSLYGTPGYAPPEQYRGVSRPRSDVYALAATLYHLLTDDDPGKHPFNFPRLPQLGRLGQVLSKALNKYVDERPTATELREALEALPGAASTRVCIMPDGSVTNDERELVAWCEAHWGKAVAWLYPRPQAGVTSATLIERFKQAWGTTDFVRKPLLAADQHRADPNHGLDAVLTLIDPQGFGAAQPHLGADHAGVDFGTLKFVTASEQMLTLTNGSRRYICADLKLPPWVSVVSPAGSATVSLRPKQSVVVKLAAQNHRGQMAAGFLSSELVVKMETVMLLQVPLRATVPAIASMNTLPVQQPAQPLNRRRTNSGPVITGAVFFMVIAFSLLNAGSVGFPMVIMVGLVVLVIMVVNMLSD